MTSPAHHRSRQASRAARALTGAITLALVATMAVATPGNATAGHSEQVASTAARAEAAPASAVPEPDILSVDFTDDGPVEHIQDRPVAAEGTAPTIVYDETVQRNVAEFAAADSAESTGTGGYVYDIPDAWSASDPGHHDDVDVLDGGTFECYFRYDGDNPVPSGQSSQLCGGGPQGYAFYLPATGCCVRFKATATTANKNTATAPVPTKSGEWVHAVATVGDGDIDLYLNGVPATQLPQEPGNGVGTGHNHLGPYTKLNVDSVPKWGIGAAPTDDGITTPTHAAIAASRVWSTVLTDTQIAQLWREERPTPPEVDVPEANILDVDFSDDDAPFADHSESNREPGVTGTADVKANPAFATQPHNVYTTDGEKDHVFYPLQDAWADTGKPHTDDIATYKDDTWAGDGLTIQCDVKINESLPADGAPHFCSDKSGGGFGLHIDKSSIVASFHINGGYKSVTSPPVRSGVWHSVTATFDGTEIDLYLDGELVGTNSNNTAGPLLAPTAGSIIEPYVRFFAIGSDVKGNGAIESPAEVSVGTARLWDTALSAEQAAQLDRDSFGDRNIDIDLTSTTPSAGTKLNSPTEFDVAISNQDQATGWTYELDGEPIEPGEEIGAGMDAGEHTIAISATDVFGNPLDWTVDFTSSDIPGGGGTDTGQGKGVVTLSAIANGDGELKTTFKRAGLTVADGGFQGTIARSPENLPLDLGDIQDRTEVTGELTTGDDETVDSPASHSRVPFQRFDVALPNDRTGQQLLWDGVVDPARTARLWAWDTVHETWAPIDEARGSADTTHLQGVLRPRTIDTSDPEAPVVHVVVTAEDPFADDLAPRDASAGTPEAKDHLEDPSDYDFSFVHYTDAQYSTEVASGSQMDWSSSLPWQHIDGATNTPEEASVFEEALRQQNEWIADNKDDRKIGFVANTGDVVNSEVSGNDLQFDPDAAEPGGGPTMYDKTTSDGKVAGIKEQIKNEFSTVRDLQEPLWTSGVPNQAIAGNHDNRSGTHNGPTSPFAAFFSAADYYDQAAEYWPSDASYHTMDEETDPETDETVTPGHDSSNNYVLFSAGGLDFVAVALSYGVTQEESDWADEVLKRYPDRNAILVTHGYLSASSAPDGRDGPIGADGDKLYDEIVRDNDNVFLVVGGHFHGVATNPEVVSGPKSDHRVVQLLADYQGYLVPAERIFTPEQCEAAGLDPKTQCITGTGDDAGKIDVDGDGNWDHKSSDKLALGASFLRMLQFNTRDNTMAVDTYSPFLDEYGATPYDHGNSPKDTPEPIDRYNGAEDNLTVPIDLSTRTTSFASDGLAVVTPTDDVIGTDTAKSGFPATVEWAGLVEGKTYAWVASSVQTGDDSGVVDQFGGVFVATAAGTDKQPPTLTIPKATTVQRGATFDPLDGVSASDDTDGDVTDRIEVIGGVDTSKPGPYLLTYRVEDSNGNQSVGSRLVTVAKKIDAAVVGEARSTTYGKPARVTVSVWGDRPTGTVTLAKQGRRLGSATLRRGTTTVRIPKRALKPGRHRLVLRYTGDARNRASRSKVVLEIAKARANVQLGIKRKNRHHGKFTLVATVRVNGAGVGVRPTGKVRVRAGSRTRVGRLRSGRVTVSLGRHRAQARPVLVANYRGDATFAPRAVRKRVGRS